MKTNSQKQRCLALRYDICYATKILNVSRFRRVRQIDIFLALIFAASGSERFGSSILFIKPT